MLLVWTKTRSVTHVTRAWAYFAEKKPQRRTEALWDIHPCFLPPHMRVCVCMCMCVSGCGNCSCFTFHPIAPMATKDKLSFCYYEHPTHGARHVQPSQKFELKSLLNTSLQSFFRCVHYLRSFLSAENSQKWNTICHSQRNSACCTLLIL